MSEGALTARNGDRGPRGYRTPDGEWKHLTPEMAEEINILVTERLLEFNEDFIENLRIPPLSDMLGITNGNST